jgi:hypothetical protein
MEGKSGEGEEEGVHRAQVDDLLIALADLRSLPETRFFVARGIGGDTWSTESAAPAATPFSALVLPVREPGRERARGSERGRGRVREMVRRGRDPSRLCVIWAEFPSMLCHAQKRSPEPDYPGCLIYCFPFIDQKNRKYKI